MLTSIGMKNTKMLTQDFLGKKRSVKHGLIEPLPKETWWSLLWAGLLIKLFWTLEQLQGHTSANVTGHSFSWIYIQRDTSKACGILWSLSTSLHFFYAPLPWLTLIHNFCHDELNTSSRKRNTKVCPSISVNSIA